MQSTKKNTKVWQWLLALSCCLLSAACSNTHSLPRLAQDAVILCFGDSITFGTGAEETESYPAVLEKLVGRKVVNRGVPGEVSAEGLQRLPGVLDETRPQLMVLCLGVNDIRKGMDLGQLRDNMEKMLALAYRRGVAVVLLAAPGLELTLTPHLVPDFIAHCPPALYAELARDFGAPLEPAILWRIVNDRNLKADSLHPNAAGYREMAEAVAKVLRENGAIR